MVRLKEAIDKAQVILQEQEVFTLNMAVVRKASAGVSQYLKLVQKMVKDGGGKVVVVKKDNNNAEIDSANASMPGFLGTATVPLKALKKAK